MTVPVVDLFAGPGGLGEGFSALQHGERFQLRVSIEKDKEAHRTLWLRALFRHLDDFRAYDAYRKESPATRRSSLEALRHAQPSAARAADLEAWHAELSPSNHIEIRDRITAALGKTDRWALIGGPPCQAYSLVGRSRMRRLRGEAFESDERHLLYQEYLRILADHLPPVFVMENVKGLLSSELDGGRIFTQILHDLERPRAAIAGLHGEKSYDVLPVVDGSTRGGETYVVRAEEHGIPQARHRVILLGVRRDLGRIPTGLLPSDDRVPVSAVIGDLPAVRSGLTREADSAFAWHRTIEEGARVIRRAVLSENGSAGQLFKTLLEAQKRSDQLDYRGSHYRDWDALPESYGDWYRGSPPVTGVTGHVSRAHMPTDIWRYLYASAYAEATGRSPRIGEFPTELLPAHANLSGDRPPIFADRFRVQVADRPATTVTAHIAKDGHAFIHFDPSQARSLTIREAARLQTFPDSYEFEGSRTAQLHQIGNAVPPLLATKIASVVQELVR